MGKNDRSEGKKHGLVQIFHFPKRAKAGVPAAPERSATLPGPPADDEELVTEPYVIPPEISEARGGRPGGTQVVTPRSMRRATAGRSRSKERRLPRLTPPEVETDPGIAPERRRTRSGERRAVGVRPSGLTPQQISEMSLFGHQLFEQGRLEEARVIFEGLVGVEVKDPFPYTMLGTIFLAFGDHDRALALFEAALTLDPEEIAALVYRGEIRLNRGKLKLALADLSQAAQMGPRDDPFVDRARRLLELAHGQLRRRTKR